MNDPTTTDVTFTPDRQLTICTSSAVCISSFQNRFISLKGMSLKGHNMTNEHIAGTLFWLRGSDGFNGDSPVDAGLLWCIRILKSSTLDQSGPAGFCGNQCGVCKGKSESSGPIKYTNKPEHASGRDMTHQTKCQKHCFPSRRMKERERGGDGLLWRSDVIKQLSALYTWRSVFYKSEQHYSDWLCNKTLSV